MVQRLMPAVRQYMTPTLRSIMPAYSTVERAFQLAQSGGCQSIEDLRAALSHEGYSNAVAQTNSPLVRRQLLGLMRARAVDAAKR